MNDYIPPQNVLSLNKRFRGFLPVVVDLETSGTDPAKHALLELAAISIHMDEAGKLYPNQTWHYHLTPFEGAQFDPKSMRLHNIDPQHPFRMAISEKQALTELFQAISKQKKAADCTRAILVGHNSWFDLHFLQAAQKRAKIKKSPFHRFSSLDTASLSALFYGQTVLAQALMAAHLPYDPTEAHSALYDATQTAQLFCKILNDFAKLKR